MQIKPELLKTIRAANQAVILSHRSPDGDSIGSSLAICHFLNDLGVKANVITPDPAPDFLSWIKGFDQMHNHEQHSSEVEGMIANSDLIFCLDFNSPSRVGSLEEALQANTNAYRINIDHHQEPEDFCDLQIVDTSASSTAELVYQFIIELATLETIDLAMAEAIYTGILTDTGSFRFSSTSAKTHEIAARLISIGVQPQNVHAAVYDSYSAERLRLLGYALNEGLKLYENDKLAIISLDDSVLKKFQFKRGDTEGLVNYPLSIKSVKISILLTEKDGKIKMSFRSKGDMAVNGFARDHFDGGGHINAAGGISHIGMQATIEKIEGLIDELLKS
ncbi:MAG: phosphoesterase [Flavobacteriales bacterium]|nr:phosphoesterase [Flavobacteriales bacterium]|tara:strand:+ start:741 stop:1742 length:1002 start_codon:yes stop_codon:yes gene_type:complete